MASPTRSETDVLKCPRCGADVEDPEAGHCACCGNSLMLGGRAADGSRVPLGMSRGMGQGQAAPGLAARSPTQGALRASATGRGLSAVRQHHEFERWMSDEPTGLTTVLGMALVVVLGLAFATMALGGMLHVRGTDRQTVTAVCVVIGAVLALWHGWRILHFYQAPLLHRVACVVDERRFTTRTRYGLRTRHYATFEFEGGLRQEFPVSSRMAAQVGRGACGVAITRDEFLLAFHRTGPA